MLRVWGGGYTPQRQCAETVNAPLLTLLVYQRQMSLHEYREAASAKNSPGCQEKGRDLTVILGA